MRILELVQNMYHGQFAMNSLLEVTDAKFTGIVVTHCTLVSLATEIEQGLLKPSFVKHRVSITIYVHDSSWFK